MTRNDQTGIARHEHLGDREQHRPRAIVAEDDRVSAAFLAELGQQAAPGKDDQTRAGHGVARADASLGGRRFARCRDARPKRTAAGGTPRPRQQLQQAPEGLVVAAPRAD
jgi:hypothetical protein